MDSGRAAAFGEVVEKRLSFYWRDHIKPKLCEIHSVMMKKVYKDTAKCGMLSRVSVQPAEQKKNA